MALTTLEFLAGVTLDRTMLDKFFDRNVPNWAYFDAELGYLLLDSVAKDGLDECYTLSHYAPTGERRLVNYADQTCRINTYGNSYTQCHQVSDGETWQETLAAHIGEPVRNFGIGGYGLYQSYRRMLREEFKQPAEYIMLNVYSDDHFRSVYAWRWLHTHKFRKRFDEIMAIRQVFNFHANPWAHIRLDLDTGQFEEQENPYPTPESLYLLCDAEHVYDSFKDRLDVQTLLAKEGVSDIDQSLLSDAAAALDVPCDLGTVEATMATGEEILRMYAMRASMYVIDKAIEYTTSHDKKLMVLLSHARGWFLRLAKGQQRFDLPFLEYLEQSGLPYADVLPDHIQDYGQFNCTPEEYMYRYWVGHYNPTGNHFFAFAVKDALVDWLDPKPPAYRPKGKTSPANHSGVREIKESSQW